MSSAGRPEFFLDRSLGKITATRLREAGCVVHLIADHYPDDASDVPDGEWIAEDCSQGWLLLTKDKRIRYRAGELEALPKIERLAREEAIGFWHVYRDGQVKRMWP